MTALVFLLDLLVVAAMLWLATSVLWARQLLKAVVLFFVFSLLVAFTWARLHAPDVALAEAALGAGLTSSLLLATVRRLTRSGPGQDAYPPPEQESR
jgi:uncharacterized MnhB-related membrane protein